MKNTRSFALLLAALAFAVLAFNFAMAQQWKPLDPAHVALKAPVVEKDADAEALLWEVYINDASDDTYEFVHFLRVKIFTERGKESQSRIDIPYFSGTQVKDISGRTIKADGAIVELKKEAVFDREVIRFGGLKLKSKSFAMPGVEPGAIVEYRYREIFRGGANYVQLHFQRDIPVHAVRYYLKPHPLAVNPMRTMMFQGKFTGFQVTIELPAGFALDNAEAPSPLDFGSAGKYEVNLGVTQDRKQLSYKRQLRFNGLVFKKEAYPNLKRAFDAVHKQDNHTVTLKQDAATTAVKQ